MPRNNRGTSAGSARRATRSSRVNIPSSGTDNPSRADKKTIEFLNLVLKNELTAINQYFLHSRMLSDWGVSQLAKHEHNESLGEMRHADELIARILFLGGLPNLQYLDKLLIGEDVREILVCDLQLEEKALVDLRDAIAHAIKVGDHGSRLLYETILKNEEEHVDYLETQLRLVQSVGIANYVQLQSEPGAAGGN